MFEGFKIVSSDASFKPLMFSENNIHLGDVKDKFAHGFTFANISESKISDINIVTSCNCANAKIEPSVILPGETGHLTVEVDLANRRKGRQEYSIDLTYELDKVYIEHLTFSAFNAADLVFIPPKFDLSTHLSEKVVRPISLLDYREKCLTINNVRTDESWLAARLTKTPTSYNQGWLFGIEVTVDFSKFTNGVKHGNIEISTDDPLNPLLVFPVQCEKLSNFTIVPAVIVLPELSEGLIEKTLSINAKSDTLVEILVVTCRPENLLNSYEIKNDLENNKSIINLVINPSVDASIEDNVGIEVRTNDPCEKEIFIPVAIF